MANKIIKQLREMRAPEIGIFFFIHNKIYGWGDPVKEMTPFNGFYDSPLTHMEYFDDLVDTFPELHLSHTDDYAMFPRGRVLFSDKINKFIVYADRCVLQDSVKKEMVLEEFSLPRDSVIWRWDEHYTCASCDPSLVEINLLNKKAMK